MTVYTETVIRGVVDYQIAIIDVSEGVRVTGRIEGDRVAIGDTVVELEARCGVRYFSGLRQ
jgi:uncharacterized OB-fold protein